MFFFSKKEKKTVVTRSNSGAMQKNALYICTEKNIKWKKNLKHTNILHHYFNERGKKCSCTV